MSQVSPTGPVAVFYGLTRSANTVITATGKCLTVT